MAEAEGLRTVAATRYLAPLREGGSLPAVVEADDGALYVAKFVGAGHGHRALAAEVIAAGLAAALGLPVPELVLLALDPLLGRSEPDAEIQDLLRASAGLNLGVRFLSGALSFEPALAPPPGPEQAADIVWFDAFVTNVDRTAQNPNLLVWRDALWLIDHGSALYFHHSWDGYRDRAATPFAAIRRHVLLGLAGDLAAADARARERLGAAAVDAVLARLPDAWLGDVPALGGPAAHRRAYAEFLALRLAASDAFVQEAARARAEVV